MKEKRFIEVEIEVECDEGDMTTHSWNQFTQLSETITNSNIYPFYPVVTDVRGPFVKPRFVAKWGNGIKEDTVFKLSPENISAIKHKRNEQREHSILGLAGHSYQTLQIIAKGMNIETGESNQSTLGLITAIINAMYPEDY